MIMPISAGHKQNTAAFQWTNWLSPKGTPPRMRFGNSQSENDDEQISSPTRSRPRRASFDQTQPPWMQTTTTTTTTTMASPPPPRGRLNEERRGESYFVSLGGGNALFGRGAAVDAVVAGASKSASMDSDDAMSLVTASRSSDEALDHDHYARAIAGRRGPNDDLASSSGSSSRSTGSLLTAFLIHLNSLLPEYCDHLSSATSDALRSSGSAAGRGGGGGGGGASEAVAVLERGAKTISVAFGGANGGGEAGGTPPQCSPTRTAVRMPSSDASSSVVSAPSSPSYLMGLSPAKRQQDLCLSPKSDTACSPTKFAPDLSHWLLPLSPRGGGADSQERGHGGRTRLSPNRRSKKSGAKWTSVAESEWERFVSPFLMLAGAECLYGKMEHVLDPKISTEEGESPSSLPEDEGLPSEAAVVATDRRREGGSPFVKFATQPLGGGRGGRDENAAEKVRSDSLARRRGGGDPPPSPASPADANKRGSRRLISMYRQIREDLIIVGEYLCDPVLGARLGGGDGKRGRGGGSVEKQRMPPPPLHCLESSSSQSSWSPTKIGGNRANPDKTESNNDPNQTNKHNTYIQRELAAISLRHALDALVVLIDARCVLVRVHAELCSSSPSSPWSGAASVGQGNARPSEGGRSCGKWMALAEQCRRVLDPVSAWAKEKGWRVISNLERELRAMELALTSVHNLFECDLFNCVLNVRRLHVLLSKTHRPQTTSLPIMYIRSSLPELLSMMHVYFADVGSALQMLRNAQTFSSQRSSQTSGLSSYRLEDATKSSSAKPNVTDYNSFFTEFVSKNENGVPLAVAVVHRAGGRRDLSLEERKCDDGKDEKDPGSLISWEPVFVKSNVNCGNDVTSGDHPGEKNSIFNRGQGPNLVRIIRENFSTERETDSKTSDSNADGGNRTKVRGAGRSWPFNKWPQIEKVLIKHSSVAEKADATKYCIESVDVKAFASNNDINGKNRRHSSTSKQSKFLSHCHISSIADSLCLVVIQGVGNTKRQRTSDDDILLFMRMMVAKLRPENLMSIKVVMRLKSDLLHVQDRSQHEPSKDLTPADDNAHAASLWSESGWSDAQRKKILHSLGLRRKHSPVMAPLKSPYVKRQISGRKGRQRRRKTKDSINHAHLDFFLGPELSHLL